MRISIVTISFNQAQFLEQALLSVINQKYPNLEYIVVDPGSTDGSREIIEKYQNQISQIIFDPDDGPADGLNKGFHQATGEIFAFLNADDTLLPNAIQKVVDFFIQKPNIDVVSGHGYYIDEHGRIIRPVYSHHFNLKAYGYGVCTLVQQSTFFRKEIYERVGGFNPLNRIQWDGELWVDFALNGAKFLRVNQFLSCFRITGDSITGSGKHRYLSISEHNRVAQEKIGIPTSHLQWQWPRWWWWIQTRLLDFYVTLRRLHDAIRLKDFSRGVHYSANLKNHRENR